MLLNTGHPFLVKLGLQTGLVKIVTLVKDDLKRTLNAATDVIRNDLGDGAIAEQSPRFTGGFLEHRKKLSVAVNDSVVVAKGKVMIKKIGICSHAQPVTAVNVLGEVILRSITLSLICRAMY